MNGLACRTHGGSELRPKDGKVGTEVGGTSAPGELLPCRASGGKLLRRWASVLVPLLLLTAISLVLYAVVMDIRTPSHPARTEPPHVVAAKEDTVFVGVVSRFAPNIIYEGYQPIIDYLNACTPYHFTLRLGRSYAETIEQLNRGEIQLAFVGTYVYVKARQHYPIRCILRPLNSQRQPYFRSVLVTRVDSPIAGPGDLVGKRLALPSPLSFSANWILQAELPAHGVRPQDLGEVRHFDFHHTVIYEILSGRFDAGVVKDRVAEEFLDKGIRIVSSSPPIPGSPLIVRSNLNSALVSTVREALLRIDTRRPEYRRLLHDWDPEFVHGFAPAEDSDYNGADRVLVTGRDDL